MSTLQDKIQEYLEHLLNENEPYIPDYAHDIIIEVQEFLYKGIYKEAEQ